eukprot:scaffold20.g7877.t1
MTFFVMAGIATAVFFATPNKDTFAQGAADTSGVSSAVSRGLSDTAAQKLFYDLWATLEINSSFGVNTALAFGFGIVVMAYAIGHVSGGHLNAAVTISLGIGNIIAQGLGSTLAAGFLYGMLPNPNESTLGSNSISPFYTQGQAFLGEAVMTCLLCFVVHMTAVDRKNAAGQLGFAPLAIGFAVLLGHTVMIPVDGCSINPTRSFGPALVSGTWDNFWVFVFGPILGGLVAVPLWWLVSQPALERFTISSHDVAAAEIEAAKAMEQVEAPELPKV